MNSVADLGQFLKALNGLNLRINLLLVDIYSEAGGNDRPITATRNSKRFGVRCGPQKIRALL
jgi:hypothetical protein